MLGIIGFNLSKVEADRTPLVKGKISIKNNIQVKTIEKSDLFLGKSKQEGLKFGFEYSSLYEPNAGKIIIVGDLVAVEEKEEVKKILEKWKKDKKVEAEVMAQVINTVLSKCSVQAILLSRDLGLPSPVQLPKVQVKK